VSLVIGVDAGGSSVVGRSDQDGFLLAEGANVRSLGVELSAQRILRVVNALARSSTPSAVYVGAAGAGDPMLASSLQERLARALPQSQVAVGNDLEIALRASIRQGDGVALVAGTGSTAYAEIAGKRYRAGGHGPLLGDEGSGFAIGRDALRRTLRAIDGRDPRTDFTEEIERQFGASAHDMLERTSAEQRKIAAIAPLVIRYAERDDPVALRIVREAVCDLFDLLKAVLGKARSERRELPVVLAGGLFKENNLLRNELESRIARESLLRVVAARESAVGALALARRLLEHQNA
jgi:N-acetylglucosamine kinase-like BadF-type ATPase